MEAGPSRSKRGGGDYEETRAKRKRHAPRQERVGEAKAGCSNWMQDSDDDSSQPELTQSVVRLMRASQTPGGLVRVAVPGAPRSGVILKIVLKNFMCHSHMEINLNPRINFIVGRNGSGKSAILTALVVGLGGSACTTNRGSSLKQFIKNGKTSGSIEITLNNDGCSSYRPELFGKTIVVTRRLTEAGSSYSIKGSDGTLHFTKREELDQIVSHMNIQVDNPISVLNQDTARTFLNASNVHEKYLLFMRATQLQMLWEIALRTLQSKRIAMAMLREKRAALQITSKEVDDLEVRWNQVQAVRGYRKRICGLRDELNWSLAILEERNLATLERKRAELEGLLPALQLAIENQTRGEVEARERLADVEGRINEIREEASGKEATYLESKAKGARCKESYARVLQAYKVLGVKVRRHETNVVSLRNEISKLQGGNEANSAESRRRAREHIAAQENRFQEMTATQKTVDHHLSQLRSHEDRHREELQQNRAELVECNRKLDKLKEQISTMQSNSSDKLAVYGRYMPVLVQKINEAARQGMFKKVPIGPVGAYIQVKDATWAPAIENFLGAFLRNFCVDNPEDHAALNVVLASVLGTQKKPTVIISKFYPTMHAVGQHEVRAPRGMSSLLNALTVANPVVANCLIDQRDAETILLIPTSEEACVLMRDRNNVPRNCKRSVTKQGEQFYPDPDYRTYAGDVNARSQYLQVNMAEFIESKQAELKNVEVRKAWLDGETRRMTDAARGNDVEVSRLRRERTGLQRALLQLGAEIRSLRDSEEPETTSVATLHSELEESSVQLSSLKEEEAGLAAECEQLKAALEEARLETNELRESARTLQSREHPLLVELENVREELRELTNERGYRDRKLKDAQDKVNAMQARVTEHQELTNKAVELAARLHPERIATERDPNDLDHEIRGLERILKTVESSSGRYVEVGAELNEKKTRLKRVTYMIEEVGKALDLLDETLEGRKVVYTRIQNFTSVNVNDMFSIMLREIGFTGEVKIDHVRQELVIEVRPSHRASADDTKTLSGGERSYSTVVFIMSLWDVTNPPFFFLDEFDVFMDKVNRRLTLEMLTMQAKTKQNHQFVFLTPQDLSSITASDDVSIHRMENPRDD